MSSNQSDVRPRSRAAPEASTKPPAAQRDTSTWPWGPVSRSNDPDRRDQPVRPVILCNYGMETGIFTRPNGRFYFCKGRHSIKIKGLQNKESISMFEGTNCQTNRTQKVLVFLKRRESKNSIFRLQSVAVPSDSRQVTPSRSSRGQSSAETSTRSQRAEVQAEEAGALRISAPGPACCSVCPQRCSAPSSCSPLSKNPS